MSLTEEQKLDLLRRYINSQTDFVKAPNGLILLSVEASSRIAKELNLKLVQNGQFNPRAICNYIIKKEEQRLAAKASVERLNRQKEEKKEELKTKIYVVIEKILDLQKKYSGEELEYNIAVCLLDLVYNGDIDFNVLHMGLEAAVSSDILPGNHKVKEFVSLQEKLENLFIKISYIKEQEADEDQLIERVGDAFLSYLDGDSLIFRCIADTLMNVGFNPEQIDKIKASIFEKYEPQFIKKYQKADFTDEDVVREIYDNYIVSNKDMDMFLKAISSIDHRIDINDIRYQFFCLSGQNKQVIEIVRDKSLSLDECADKLVQMMHLQDITLYCIKKTFNNMKYIGYHHPYSELIKKINGKLTESLVVVEEEIEELVPVNNSVAVLSDTGDQFIEDEDLPRRLQIINKEKSLKDSEKKTTLAALLIGAGFIPVAVLSVVLKADPIEIARNSATALNELAKNSANIGEVLPNVATLTALFAGMGTSFIGFVNYLKNRFKVSKTKKELQELEDLEYFEEYEKQK